MPFSAIMRAIALCFAFAIQPSAALCADAADVTFTCKCIPGDECWPSAQDWAEFNTTIGGKLVTPIQLAAVCHNPGFDEKACEVVQRNWTSPWLHDASSSSLMAAAVANESCSPFTSRELPCEPGDTVTYSVNATDAYDFVKALQFARQRNIRLVIRNTGHDYMGKSTGKWALSVWTHHMKKIEYVPYSSEHYDGPAIRLGAGVQVEEAYEAAHAYNAVVVGGDCATVGVVGGYLQGGGHSALSSLYGMAADQVLEWEVVDGTGTILQASPSSNPDLYWALSGGGGGTYGIVSSVVVKLLPDVPITGLQLQFGVQDPAKLESFQLAVRTYHQLIPGITEAKGMGISLVTNDTFSLTPLTLPSSSNDSAQALLAPLVEELETQGIVYNLSITEYPNWLQYWQNLIKPNPTQLVQNAQYGGWFLPKQVVAEQADALQRALQEITDEGCVFVGLALNVSRTRTTPHNSVMPSWRQASLSVILSTPWPAKADWRSMKKKAHAMTHVCVPALSHLAPEAGTYLNEADPNQPNWQKAFYGINYDSLLAIKNRYDPDHMFYAPTAVGSDAFFLDKAERLCLSE